MNRQMLFTYSKKALAKTTSFPYQEALSLLGFALEISPTNLLAHLEYSVSEEQAKHFFLLIERRYQGEPLAYLTGQCEFWSLPLTVTPSCLIPRQDTELIVEQILAGYSNKAIKKVLELGTGSGAIAIALSLERPNWEIIATDLSLAALKLANYNAKQLGAAVYFRQGNWFEALDKEAKKSFDLIISNPPYLSQEDPHLKNSLGYEPQIALIGGQKGTEILERLVQEAPTYLKPGGHLWLEQGFDQAEKVRSYLTYRGYEKVQQYPDIQGIIRVSSGKWSAS